MEKRFRLRKSGDFRLVRSAGRSWAHPLLVLYARPNGLDQTRVGFAVSKRIGNAVTRNRVRRRLREGVRSLPLRPGWDVVISAKAAAAGADFHELREAVADLLARARILSEEAHPGGVQP